MTTALDLIKSAYIKLGAKTVYQTPLGEEAIYALTVLNDLIDSWNTDELYVFNIDEVVQTVTTSPITIGPGGTINISRPLALEKGSFVRINAVDYQIQPISFIEYQEISAKAISTSMPFMAYYTPAVPLGTLYLYPVPSIGVSVHLFFQEKLTQFVDLETQYNLSDGYKRALTLSLVEELSLGTRPISADLRRQAQIARQNIRKINTNVPILEVGHGRPVSGLAAFMAGL